MSSFVLRVIAMIAMAIDHIGAIIFPYNLTFRLIGRIAFPIFAYQIVEGYFKTHDVNSYIKRMFIFALLTEIPFDLMNDGVILSFRYQNVLFTFTLALVVIETLDRIRKTNTKMISKVLASILMILLGVALGNAFTLDYYGFGVLLCVIFYYSKVYSKKKYQELIGVMLGMFLVNWVILGGFLVPVNFFNLVTLHIPVQGFALLSFVPIALYNGKLGYSSKGFRYFCYFFYPVHMMLIYLTKIYFF